jgi:hypothetical protein
MTKEAYLEMCEALGSEPDPKELPVEFSDLPDQVQQCFEIYTFLPDRWEGMSGTFMGKDYSIVFQLFDSFQIVENSDRVVMLRIMSAIDASRSKIIQQKQKQREQKPSS